MQTISTSEKKTLQFTRQLKSQLGASGLCLNKRQSRRLSDDVKISFSDSNTTRQDDADDIVWQIRYDDRLMEEKRFDCLYLIDNECRSRSSCLDSSERCSSSESDDSDHVDQASQKSMKPCVIDTHSCDSESS
jgi:hypothetical protein